MASQWDVNANQRDTFSHKKANKMGHIALSTAERDALTVSEKETGMMIYNTTTTTDQIFTGSVWKEWGDT